MILNIIIIIAILSALLLFHEFGHFLIAKLGGVRVDEFGLGFPPKIFAFQHGETKYSVNLIPVGAFVRMPNREELTPRNLYFKNPWFKLLENSAGLIFNIILAFILFTTALTMPTSIITGGEGVKVTQVSAGYPAAEADIREGDVILSINGQDVQALTDVSKIIQDRTGTETQITLQRADEIITINLVPATGERPLGITLGWLKEYTTTYRLSLLEAISESADIIIHIPTTMRNLISSLIRNPADNLMGPIGAAQVTGEMIKYGASSVVSVAGSISLGLALFNLIPIPPLDGAGMALALLEILRRGKRLSIKYEQLIYTLGTFLLIILTVFVWYNDILRLIRG